MLPFITCIWSSIIWFSTTTSTFGKSVMVGVMFFIRAAMPLSFCGIRLHIDIHWNSSSSWLNSFVLVVWLGVGVAGVESARYHLHFLRLGSLSEVVP